MNLREILSAVMGESGFLVPDSFFGSTSPDDLQMCYLANRASSYLREQGYQKLIKRGTITLTSATSYALPSDYLEIVPNTSMIEGRIDAMDLPTDPSTWAYLQSVSSTSDYTVHARIINGEFAVFAPTVGEVVAFEYISNSPILDTDGTTYKQRFTADTDNWLLDDDLLILEIKWRYKKEKGIADWQTDMQEAAQYRNSVMARDKSGKTIGGSRYLLGGEPYTNLWIS